MMTIDYTDLYVDGRWVAPATNSIIPVISPATEERIGSVPDGSEADIDAAVAAARAAFDDPAGWARWDGKRRAEVLAEFAEKLAERGEETASRVSSQNGMPISLARQFESGFPALLLQYYGTMVAEQEDEIRPGMLGGSTAVTRSPIGVVGAIVPWNVPQAITFLKIAPALAAGCTVVLKPAPETVLDAFLMAEAALAAGLPAGVLNVVPGGREIGSYLVSHPGVDKVSFTGSTGAGRAIARTCGELLRPVTLELGGKSAAVVLDDANLADNIESFFGATMLNNGQICWLSTRVLAPAARYNDVVDTVTDLAKNIVVGDPLAAATQMGPLVSARQRDRVEGYIAAGRSDGGRITTGGGRAAERGWFVEPTIFADVQPGHTIAREEIFGPVLSVIPYADEDEAVAIANASEYGLGGTVWTADPERGARFAHRIASGTVGINGYANDPTAPFGGIKNSGMGRELGPEGLAGYQNVKSIYLDVR
ncbi:aldehyde dehydrogenase [Nocardia nova]|uniref:Aldehyde dehydrogenase n=2 Tax=Nocardia nova TaxID=37330 RepID=A0A2S6AIJ5_9NOCA|nr:aldehyde dehydrogenase [Nocardia nova]PPJ35042.1 aldehyde dehydrogenase [Nocardia nova]